MDFIKSEEMEIDAKEEMVSEMVSDKETSYDANWKMDEEIPNNLESKYGNIDNYICVDCSCKFTNEDCLSAHMQSKHHEYKPKKDISPFNSLANPKRMITSQNVAINNKHINELEVSDSDDDSSDEFNCEENDSSSESEYEEIGLDAQVWQAEIPEALLPPPERFSFTELPHSGIVPREGSPLDYFNLFFTDELIQRIVDETNRYAVQKLDPTFDITNFDEIRVFLALTMLQGIVMKPHYFLYWSKKPLLDTPFFRQCMTQKRFSLLKRYLHFSNDQTYGPDSHPQPRLNKILYVFDYLREKFSSLYTMPRDVTIDESLKFWKERLGWDQFVSLKKSQNGIKLYMLCDSNSGYVWDIVMYTGKGTFTNEAYRDHPISSQIVMSLMNPLLGKGYCLTTNKWYTSPQLADLLIEHQTDTFGTVKQTRKGIPSQLKTKKLQQRGEFCAFRRGKVMLMKWKDKKEVTLLSTVHSSETSFHKPQIVKDYNSTIGDVDSARMDQSLSNNPIMRKRDKKYFKKIFFHLVELVVWNSFIIYKNYEQNKKPLDFRMELIDLMVASYGTIDTKAKGRPSTSATPLRLSGRHFPSYVPNTAKSDRPSRTCAACSKKRDAKGKRVRRESRYQCTECDVGLCVVPCFGEYHTKYNLTH